VSRPQLLSVNVQMQPALYFSRSDVGPPAKTKALLARAGLFVPDDLNSCILTDLPVLAKSLYLTLDCYTHSVPEQALGRSSSLSHSLRLPPTYFSYSRAQVLAASGTNSHTHFRFFQPWKIILAERIGAMTRAPWAPTVR
jgi:hypothetical protein